MNPRSPPVGAGAFGGRRVLGRLGEAVRVGQRLPRPSFVELDLRQQGEIGTRVEGQRGGALETFPRPGVVLERQLNLRPQAFVVRPLRGRGLHGRVDEAVGVGQRLPRQALGEFVPGHPLQRRGGGGGLRERAPEAALGSRFVPEFGAGLSDGDVRRRRDWKGRSLPANPGGGPAVKAPRTRASGGRDPSRGPGGSGRSRRRRDRSRSE